MSELSIRYRISGVATDISESDENLLIMEAHKNGRHTVTVEALRPLRLAEASVRAQWRFDRADRVMANGYQSWTETKEFYRDEHLNDLRRVPGFIEDRQHFRAYGSQAFWPADSGGHLGFDYSYIRGEDPLFIGSLNYKNAYLLIEFRESENLILLSSDVSHRYLEAGESFTVFDYIVSRDGRDYYNSFRPRSDRKLFGYTSWYNHYQDISEELILSSLDKADRRFDLFQIDDGYETFVGDWLNVDPIKFPNGLQPIVERIHAKGMMAGIWLAPFVAESSSRLVAEHPDWVARDQNGDYVYAGGNWSGSVALDLNNPKVTDYLRRVFQFYTDLGFDFFKLDFLYAANLRRLHGKTRAETSEFAYGLARQSLGDRLILGCGATLSNAFERFDYCRIGPDVSLRFDDVTYMRMFHPERVSTKVTVQNTVYRSRLDRHMFLNDPDVFLLRDDNIQLTWDQRVSLTKLNALFGSLLMTSDDIASYDGGKKEVLEEALGLFHRAEVRGFSRTSRGILVVYELDGVERRILYDFNKGTLTQIQRGNWL